MLQKKETTLKKKYIFLFLSGFHGCKPYLSEPERPVLLLYLHSGLHDVVFRSLHELTELLQKRQQWAEADRIPELILRLRSTANVDRKFFRKTCQSGDFPAC